MKFRCSLDTPIKVKLTPKGRAVVSAMMLTVIDTNVLPTGFEQYSTSLLNLDTDGYIELSLWQFATYFGGLIQVGGVLENNSIYFEVNDEAHVS